MDGPPTGVQFIVRPNPIEFFARAYLKDTVEYSLNICLNNKYCYYLCNNKVFTGTCSKCKFIKHVKGTRDYIPF